MLLGVSGNIYPFFLCKDVVKINAVLDFRGKMAYFVSSTSESAKDFLSFSLSLSGGGNLVHIIAAGHGADSLRELGMADFFTDYARLSRTSLRERAVEDLTERDASELGREIVSTLNDLASTMILEVGTSLSFAIARAGSSISENMRVVYFCGKSCNPEDLIKQFGLRRPHDIIYSGTQTQTLGEGCKALENMHSREFFFTDLRYRYDRFKCEIFKALQIDEYFRRTFFENINREDNNEPIILTFGSCEEDDEIRCEELDLLISCLDVTKKRNMNGLIICHKPSKIYRNEEMRRLDKWASRQENVILVYKSKDWVEVAGCCELVISPDNMLAIDCAMAGVNLISIGSPEKRKKMNLYLSPQMCRFADNRVAFEKIYPSEKWIVDVGAINRKLNFDPDWEETLRRVIFRDR